MGLTERFNIHELGRPDGPPMIFAHGYGCDQNMWRLVTGRFTEHYRVILFDHIGAGGSDLSAYDDRHRSLQGYAQDVVEICQGLGLRDVIYVGHSVSGMIGVLAAAQAPELFAHLVLVGPSPRYINDDGYVGGFDEQDIRELLDSLDSNYLGWSNAMAPMIMGNADRPELAEELESSFCRSDPEIAKKFARVTFMSDNRDDLAQVSTPSLVLQCTNDAIAPIDVGTYVAEHLQNATLVMLDATGHCPNLSAPEQTADAIEGYLPRPAHV